MTPLDNFLLRSYLQGELDDAEEAAFELLMLDRPDLAELVEADTALSIGLQDSTRANPANHPANAPRNEGPPREIGDAVVKPIGPTKRGPRNTGFLSLAAAASVALAVGIGAGFQLSGSSKRLQPTTLAYVDSFRDSTANPEIPIPDTQTMVLTVPVVSLERCTATVDLRQGDLNLSAQSMPDEHSNVSLVLDPALLSAGEAEIVVSCAEQVLGEYRLRFVSK